MQGIKGNSITVLVVQTRMVMHGAVREAVAEGLTWG